MAASETRAILRAPLRRYLSFRFRTTGKFVTPFISANAEVSLDDAGFNNTTNPPTEIAGSGIGFVDLTVAETSADSKVILHATDADLDSMDFFDEIAFEPSADSGVATGGTLGTITAGGTIVLPNTAPGYDALTGLVLEIVRGTGAGQMRVIRSYDPGTFTATTDRPWLSVGTVPDNTSVYIVHPRHRPRHVGGGAIDLDLSLIQGISLPARSADWFAGVVYGTVNDGFPTSGGFIGNSGLAATNDFYKHMVLGFTSGPLQGVWNEITAYNGSTKLLTFAANFPAAPANADSFIIASYLTR